MNVSSSRLPEVISILGGGWSALMVDRDHLPGMVVGVNDSGVLVARCDLIVSMDRLWAEYRWPTMLELQRTASIRTAALKNMAERPKWLRPFECDYKSTQFSVESGRLNGTNSGLCAMNWAWRARPKRLYLIGFDMNRSPNGAAYWYPPYPWTQAEGATKPGKYDQWAREMEHAAAQFKAVGTEVLNVSATSSIEAFRKITPKDFQKELS